MDVRQTLDGRYKLLNELGSGGMAVVWRARDEVLGRPVAVKLLAARYASDPQSRARIRDEARSAATLSHPNIAQVYDYGEATGSETPLPYVVMELVNGPTLQQRVANGPLPPRTVFRICGEVAAALAAAHADGLVHRDIKMANILVAPTGAKVVDFGIAAAVGRRAPEEMLVGTPAYLAPERLTGDAVLPASDVYALGVLLYRLLTNESPWSVETTTQMLQAHVYVEPAPLPPLPAVPPAVAALITRCLQKDPDSRPTASEVSATLADAAEAADHSIPVRGDRPEPGVRVPHPAAGGHVDSGDRVARPAAGDRADSGGRVAHPAVGDRAASGGRVAHPPTGDRAGSGGRVTRPAAGDRAEPGGQVSHPAVGAAGSSGVAAGISGIVGQGASPAKVRNDKLSGISGGPRQRGGDSGQDAVESVAAVENGPERRADRRRGRGEPGGAMVPGLGVESRLRSAAGQGVAQPGDADERSGTEAGGSGRRSAVGGGLVRPGVGQGGGSVSGGGVGGRRRGGLGAETVVDFGGLVGAGGEGARTGRAGAVVGGRNSVQRKRKALLAGGGLACLIVAGLAGWGLTGESAAERKGGQGAPVVVPTASRQGNSHKGSSVAPVEEPTATAMPGRGVVTGSPSASVGSSMAVSPSGSGGSPEPSRSGEPSVSASPAPQGKRLSSPGGSVTAVCAQGKATLTSWEEADGFEVERVDPGPKINAVIIFKGERARYRMTVTCVAGTPTPVVLPL